MFFLLACASAESPTPPAPEVAPAVETPAVEAPAVDEPAAPAEEEVDGLTPTVGYEAVDPACASCERIEGTATASTSLTEGSKTYPAELAFDGSNTTAWCEGAEGTGRGSTLTLTWEKRADVQFLWLYPGYMKSDAHYFENARPSYLRIISGERAHDVLIEDVAPGELEKASALGLLIPLEWEDVTSLEIMVMAVHEGEKYADMCISEVEVIGLPLE